MMEHLCTLEQLINNQDKYGITFNRYRESDNTLTDANLVGANLTDANLVGANLTDADLTRADLTDADLYGANLAGANLTDADLHGANLADADLTRADLTRANLARANLARANLTGAKLNLPLNMTSGNFDIHYSQDTDGNFTYYAGCFSGSVDKMIEKAKAVRTPEQAKKIFYRCLSICSGTSDEAVFLDAIKQLQEAG